MKEDRRDRFLEFFWRNQDEKELKGDALAQKIISKRNIDKNTTFKMIHRIWNLMFNEDLEINGDIIQKCVQMLKMEHADKWMISLVARGGSKAADFLAVEIMRRLAVKATNFVVQNSDERYRCGILESVV